MTTILIPLVLAVAGDLSTGPWRATVSSPTGEVPFRFVVERRDSAQVAVIRNGEESIERPLVAAADGEVRIEFPWYDARIVARAGDGGATLAGAWTKVASTGHEVRMDFRARAGDAPRFEPAAGAPSAAGTIAGRWSLRFAGDGPPAVLVLRAEEERVLGTVLTSTGDHRFLEGVFAGRNLRLSSFDGAHAYLYDATLAEDGTLAGRFVAGPDTERAWTAARDADARLGDELALSRWSSEPGLLFVEGLDREGRPRSLGELAFGARALVVQIAGSWCPNCHDELAWLSPLAKELAPKGLRVVTLGFEVRDDEARARQQLDRMRERHGAEHEFLFAGLAGRERATAAIGAIDRVVGFPTLAILRADGSAAAVHAGFSGPATGADFERTKKDLRARIEAALAEAEPASAALERLVAEGLWRDERDRTFFTVRRDGDRVVYVETEMFRFDGPTREEPVSEGVVVAHGDVLRVGTELWQFDRRAGVALDPRDLSHRLTPAARGPFPAVGDGRSHAEATDAPEKVLAALSSSDAVLRREATWYLATQILTAMFAPPDHAPIVDLQSANQLLPRLDDADPLVRATACWAVGLLRVEGAEAKLRENATHPFAAVRREARRALEPREPR